MVDLEPRRLALLRELARRGSVTAVAEALHLTPTAVSQQLKVLEREAGAALLVRRGRGVELSDAGASLARAAEELEVAQERVQASWDSYRHRVAGTVRLSVYPTAGQALLPGLLDRLAEHPDLEVVVSEADLQTDEYAALTDRVDVVLAHRAAADEHGEGAHGSPRGGRPVVVTELATEPLDVAAPPGHPIGELESVRVADVADATWVSVPVGWPFDSALTAWFAAAGRTPRVHRRFTDLRLQQALVAGGHGMALLPRRAAWQDGDRSRLVLRPVAGHGPARRIAALARTDRAERVAVRAVLRALVAEAAVVDGWIAEAGPAPDARGPRRR